MDREGFPFSAGSWKQHEISLYCRVVGTMQIHTTAGQSAVTGAQAEYPTSMNAQLMITWLSSNKACEKHIIEHITKDIGESDDSRN